LIDGIAADAKHFAIMHVPSHSSILGTASQILASINNEDAWKERFHAKRDVIRRMA
jgi:hypothetical protein